MSSAIRAASAAPRTRALYAPGHGADRPLEPGLVGQERGQQLGQTVGVPEARLIEPVGEIHLFLDARTVERSVGEAVDGEDVEAAVSRETRENASSSAGWASVAAATAESRRPTPNGRAGATDALTARTCRSRFARTSAQVSPGWMFVQYVRCGPPGTASFTVGRGGGEARRGLPITRGSRISWTSTPRPIAAQERDGELPAQVLPELREPVQHDGPPGGVA